MPLTRIQGGLIDSLPNNFVNSNNIIDGTIVSGKLNNNLFATVSNTFGVTANANTFSNSIIIVSGNTAPINVGMLVTGSNIAPGTTVLSFNTPTTGRSNIRLSQAASGSNTNTAVSFYEANKVLSPGIAAPGMAKAWVNFNGSASTMQIRAAYNVSSITDNGTGSYIVNFINAMPDAHFTATLLAGSPAVAGVGYGPAVAPTTSSFQVTTYGYNGVTATDFSFVSIAVFR